jgi:hypothetical protein
MGNEYIVLYIMFAKRLQWGWWDLVVDGDGDMPLQWEEAAARAEERRRRRPPVVAGPRGRRHLGLSSSLDLLLVWRGSSPSLAAAKEEKIRGYGWCLQKIGFPVNI